MKSFFKELFEYNFNANQQTLAALAQNPEKVSEKLLNLHSHIANAHALWNSRVIPKDILYHPWDIHHDIQELIELDKKNHHTSVAIIHQFDLDFKQPYVTRSGKPFTHSISDILFQIINHSTYHRGQVATEFRQCGIEPLLTDWIFYKM